MVIILVKCIYETSPTFRVRFKLFQICSIFMLYIKIECIRRLKLFQMCSNLTKPFFISYTARPPAHPRLTHTFFNMKVYCWSPYLNRRLERECDGPVAVRITLLDPSWLVELPHECVDTVEHSEGAGVTVARTPSALDRQFRQLVWPQQVDLQELMLVSRIRDPRTATVW